MKGPEMFLSSFQQYAGEDRCSVLLRVERIPLEGRERSRAWEWSPWWG
jgi:hypothetical protein